MEIQCPKYKNKFSPSTLDVGDDVYKDTELLAECKCGQRFYTFAELSWEPLEN